MKPHYTFKPSDGDTAVAYRIPEPERALRLDLETSPVYVTRLDALQNCFDMSGRRVQSRTDRFTVAQIRIRSSNSLASSIYRGCLYRAVGIQASKY